ncbi:NAD(P)-binding protein [Punctularia strigosozonata HHB-11173 SS5]|uniref:NAD(P)-binding protein n=1 Tax=Punctularia strigosozonata (strain HHB-11173) TaxID=741275 RepID=UPI00044175D7|nr:NAD(P)-binding protein [Punctularia strigosozonata HHB-11173 SS5]EIN06057.1 NAD(P)-binding protein [Punctularia strigosozonata HHB-11173 SS5]
MTPTVYLVSGANRGLGLGLVRTLAARPNTIVFAGARNPSTATELQTLASEQPGKVNPVKLVAADKPGNEAAVEEIKAKAGRLDVVIANAGIFQDYCSAIKATADQLREHLEVNTIGPFVLYQACFDLLKASTPNPKFVAISSGLGSIAEGARREGVLAYGLSKAAQNYLTRKLHFEHEKDGLIAFSICPGGVESEMSLKAVLAQGATVEMARASGKLKSPEFTAWYILQRIDEATREKHSGEWISFDGKRKTW